MGTRTKNMEEINLSMSNFDREVDSGFAEALEEKPGKVFGRHHGWGFNGRVFFEDGKFHEEVWIYGVPKEIITAGTLEELMEEVSNKYGWN